MDVMIIPAMPLISAKSTVRKIAMHHSDAGMVECGDWSWNKKATDSRCVVGFIPSHDAFGSLGPKQKIVYR